MSGLFLLLPLVIAAVLGQTQVSGPDYQALTAAEKQAIIWENALRTNSSNSWPGAKFYELFLEDMCVSFHTSGDEFPDSTRTGERRERYIHSVGSVGKVEFIPHHNGRYSKYSGIFKRGARHGIVRLSLALQPDPTVQKTIPGMGLKFLRDGQESANLFAMYSLAGQASWNIFANEWSNHIPGLDANTDAEKAFIAKFATATPYTRYIGLSDLAKMGKYGTEEEEVVFPFKLVFRPTNSFSDEYHGLLADDLSSIPEGSILFNVYAWDAPEDLGGQEEFIGDLVLRSKLVTSLWGDTVLFFKHQDMAEDVALRPEWEPHVVKVYDGAIPTEC